MSCGNCGNRGESHKNKWGVPVFSHSKDDSEKPRREARAAVDAKSRVLNISSKGVNNQKKQKESMGDRKNEEECTATRAKILLTRTSRSSLEAEGSWRKGKRPWSKNNHVAQGRR